MPRREVLEFVENRRKGPECLHVLAGLQQSQIELFHSFDILAMGLNMDER
jgi:hypothetical protein